MLASIEHKGNTYKVNLSEPIDISLPLQAGSENVNAFHLSPMKIEPIRMGSFVGSVAEGGPCNVNNILFNPHGNGTHTESVGHISETSYPIHKCLQKFFFLAELLSINPEMREGDAVISLSQLKAKLGNKSPEAIIIRTLPNEKSKMTRQYSGTNPAYLDHEAAKFLAAIGVQHLLLDLPSVDKEEDGGVLSAHHQFWNYPAAAREHCTITELIYVPDEVDDGTYLLNLQIASFMNDASPSKPLLYKFF
ncbi:MAG: cyclase family protein [Bacteroidetes bacterium]|nr:MAG: cyclase family protein [Bacteroidota bacterium]